MPQPPAYHRGHNFSNDHANQIDRVAINNEFDGAASSINAIRHNLALIQLDDGKLRLDAGITSLIIEQVGSDIEAHSSLAQQAADAAQNSAASASQSAGVAAASAGAAGQSASAAAQSAIDAADFVASMPSLVWDNIVGKPDQATRWPTWTEVTDKPASFGPQVVTLATLPTADIGPVIVADAVEVWVWVSTPYYTGYRSPLCGRPVYGHTVAPLANEIDAVGGIVSKSSYAGLWGYAQENNLGRRV